MLYPNTRTFLSKLCVREDVTNYPIMLNLMVIWW